MANLSNINNKFIVTDGGQALINQTAPGFNVDADDLIVGNLSGNTGITIASGPNAGNYGSLYFADAAGQGTASKAGYIRYEQNTSKMTIGINAVEKIAIALNGDTTFTGNVGIGITPNTSFSGVDVLQLGKGMTIFGNTDNDRASMCANLYLNASTEFVRVMDGFSGRFAIEDGTMLWGLSATGDANTVVTVNTKMTLLNNGNLGIGTDSPSAKLEVRQPSYANTNETAIFTNGNSSGRIAYDTLVVSQTDVATLSLVETPGTAAQEQKLTFSVGDNKAVIRTANTSGGMYFNVQASLTAPGYQATSGLTGIHIKNDGDVIMSAGKVGIGTTSPDAPLTVQAATNARAIRVLGRSFDEISELDFYKYDNSTILARLESLSNSFNINTYPSNPITFKTANVERMRIESTGYIKIADDGDTTWQGYNFHAITQSRVSEPTVMIYNDNTGGNNFGVNVIHRSSGSSTTGRFFFGGTSNGSTEKIKIYTNGSIENATNSYGQLSDLKLKENVVDATSKLDDIMKVKIKNFNYIGDDLKQLGVIAQELEEVFPGLVYDTPDSTITNKKEVFTGTSTKGVKYSIFVPMLVKAMQEQQVIIEDFKSRLKILEKN